MTIGAVLPITGGAAASGKDMSRGVQLAEDAVNAAGGVIGKQLKVKVGDSQGTAPGSVQAARKLVSVDHVPAVVGEYLSADTIAMGKYLQSVGVVDINPAATSPTLPSIGNMFFSTIGLDTISAEFTAKALYEAGYRNIAYLGPNSPAGSGIADSLKASFNKLGGKVATSILYQEGKSDYRNELQRLKSSGAQIYVYLTYVPDSLTINKDAFELGIEAKQWFGTYLSLEVQDLDKKIAAGQQGQDLTATGGTSAEFLKAYEAAYHEPPQTPFAALTYDSVMLAAKAIDRAKSVEGDEVRSALVAVGKGYEGATGTITFNAEGQRDSQPYTLLRVDDSGKLVPQDAVTGPGN